MRRAALALSAAVLAGCGNNPQEAAPWPDGAQLWVSSSFADTALAWSPFGNVLLFSQNSWIWGFDGSGEPALCTFTDMLESTGPNGCWNAENFLIVYSAVDDSTGIGQIRTIPGNGTAVTVVLDPGLPVTFPSWNPSGDSLVFSMRPLGSWSRRLFTMPHQADTLMPVEIPLLPGDCVRASYSPEGSHILFQYRETQDSPWSIWVVHPDGTGARPVAQGGHCVHPCWGPYDGWFVFSTDRWGNYELAAAHIDADTVIRITDDPSTDLYPAWNTGSNWIAFSSDRIVGFDIFSIDEPGIPVIQPR